MTTPQYNFTVNLDDLAFILKQIKIAEASTNPLSGAVENLPDLVGSPLLPYGLRTVDGSWNSLLPGMERLGAADNIMPRLVEASLRDADLSPVQFGPQVQTSYTQISGSVFDSQPRIASNLIVDQTANNPAAVAAALQMAGHANPLGEAGVIASLNTPVQVANALIQTAQAHIIAAGTDPVLLALAQQELADARETHATAFSALTAELEDAGLAVAENGTIFIQNLSPDIGLSPSFNGWMTLFGQFFDHGLDLVTKGGNGTVFVPLLPDDPLYVEGSQTNFMVLTRATQVNGPGADGVLGTADDTTHETINTTTPFIDQNQTYTSHPSHQVFLREYAMVNGKPLATGHLLTGEHGEANWAEVKAQASSMLGIQLLDMDVHDAPLLATDAYGAFLRGPNGYAQIVTVHGLVEGDPSANGGLGLLLPADTIRTGHAFLNDIAHGAAPGFADLDHNPATPPTALAADDDNVVGSLPNPNFNPALPVGPNNMPILPQTAGTYDDELLDRHFITGDGRGNENIGLTTVHTVFHSEHNRLVEDYKQTILGSGNLAVINEWLLTDVAAVPVTPAAIEALNWDGERLFQAGRFVTEMQYQHLVFEEFARAVQPSIEPFIFTNSPDIDPAIMAEFAHVVYRFGHSMLTETIDRLDFNMQSDDIGLIAAFLNPLQFDLDGAISVEAATGAIVRGMSRQTGNEIDEFVTDALRNNVLGLPLDLPTLNMSRARDTGMPSFNEARAKFYEATSDSQLKPFTSWADMAPELKNPASIINFIAAYGTHSSITSETTLAGKRVAATNLVFGGEDAPADRFDFLTSTGGWTAANSGLNDVDFWIGGLAERKNEFGGMLGATFNYVFENQLENLQNGDRFYYLSRTQGTNMLNELENNTFSKLIMRNTDLGDAGSSHLPSLIFQTPNVTLEIDITKQLGADPLEENPILQILHPKVIRHAPGLDVDGDGHADGGFLQFTGGEHVVLGGTAGNDTLRGGNGIDTLWGDAGDDHLDGGNEADQVHGGDGDDIITDVGTPAGGADFLHGDEGNDVISSGMGNDIVFGGGGSDFIITGNDFTEVFAGRGNDFILGGNGSDGLMGNEGDDWIEGGEGFDGLSGENSELFFNSPIIGHDVLNGQGNDTDYDGESGDDIMFQGPGIQRSNGMFGFDWAIHKDDPFAANSDLGIPFFPAQQQFTLRDRFDSVEGLSGWNKNDILTGAAVLKGAAGGAGAGPANPLDESDLKSQNVALIDGFAELLGFTTAQINAMAFNTSVIDITQGAEVIIGGGGSDIIRGNLGNDVIDGDAWLNVRISVLNAVLSAANPNPGELFTVDSMNAIKARMLSGEINPGQLKIVREFITGPEDSSIDTAVYSDLRANYDITVNANGTRTVAHNRGTQIDGVDTIRNIEQLQFSDQLLKINRAATGNLAVSDTRPTAGQALTASIGTVADLDGVNPASLIYKWQVGLGSIFVDIPGATGATYTPTSSVAGLQLRAVATYTDGRGAVEQVVSVPTGITGDHIIGTEGNNTRIGTLGDDIIEGRGGVDNLLGLDGDDLLDGGTGNDNMNGGNGNDILIGGTGNDTMTGGNGNDTYHVGEAGDVVIETNSNPVTGGIDTVVATISQTLGANVENLVLSGSGNINGTGNALANTIYAGSGVNTIDGAAGWDTLSYENAVTAGTSGVTLSLAVTNPAGFSVASGISGADLVRNIEYLTGSAYNDSLTGNNRANVLKGGAGNDFLDGRQDDDTIEGGLGNDVMVGGTGNDLFVFLAQFGNDTIQDFDADAAGGGQDKLDVSALGITAANFSSTVTITDVGANTHVQIGASSITLLGIGDASTVTATDFLLSA